jgi:two-component system, cell cycle response regulator
MPTILAIDDSPEIHALLDVRLRPEGLRMEHALTPTEGLAMAASLQPDLILLDVEMPGMGGLEVCSRLKADPLTSMLPVIFLTGADAVDVKVRGFDLGAVDYVTKPFDPAELRARVRAALRTKRFHDMLAARAQLDGLTGLWNRGFFNQRLADEVQAVRRYGRALSLIMLDVDHFKQLNDGYGHPFGDLVLQRIGESLSSFVRATDAACRYGGEEFALILTETSMSGAAVLAERARAAIEGLELRPRGKPVVVTASLGVIDAAALGGREHASSEALVQGADDALYRAKANGRNRVERAG